MNTAFWTYLFLLTRSSEHSSSWLLWGENAASWEGENTEGGRCWDGATLLIARCSFPTALSYPEAPWVIALQVLSSMPNKNKRGKKSVVLSLPLVIPEKFHISHASGLCKHGRWMCVYSPLYYTQYPTTAFLLCSSECVKQKRPSQDCLHHFKYQKYQGRTQQHVLTLVASHRERSSGMPWRSVPMSSVQACSCSLP